MLIILKIIDLSNFRPCERAVNAACVRKIFVEKERNIFHENNCKAHPSIERIILIRAIKKR